MNLELTPSDILTHDQFLYSCRQALEARSTKSGFDSHLRYEPFLFGSFQLTDRSVKSFRKDLKAIIEHAYAVSPQFRRDEDISLDTIAFFSLSIATLVADLKTLMLHYAAAELPTLDGVALPKRETDELPELATLFERFAAYREDSAGLTEDETLDEFVPYRRSESDFPDDAGLERAVAAEFWGLTFYLMRKTFKSHHKAIIEFLSWQFQPEQAPKEIDWRIRPPVGDAFAQFLRSLQSGGRAGAQFGSGPRGDRSGGGRSQGRGHGPRRDGPRHDGPGRFDGGQPGGRPPRGPADGPRDLAPRDLAPRRNMDSAPPPSPEASAEAIEAALEDVDRSLKILEKNSRRPGIRLKPQNSFVRRKQHMHAAEQGFETESVGEGKERAVYIKAKSK